MNSKEAFELLSSQPSIRASSNEFIRSFQIPECEFHTFRRKFGQLKSDRDNFLKLKDLATWEDLPFYSPVTELPAIKRYCVDKTVFKAHLSAEIRKPLSQLTLKGLRVRLGPLLNLISQIAEKEEVNSKTIATYGLQLVSNQTHDQTTSKFCKEIISTGNFGHTGQQISIEKSTFLLDQLEIGKQKYTGLKKKNRKYLSSSIQGGSSTPC